MINSTNLDAFKNLLRSPFFLAPAKGPFYSRLISVGALVGSAIVFPAMMLIMPTSMAIYDLSKAIFNKEYGKACTVAFLHLPLWIMATPFLMVGVTSFFITRFAIGIFSPKTIFYYNHDVLEKAINQLNFNDEEIKCLVRLLSKGLDKVIVDNYFSSNKKLISEIRKYVDDVGLSNIVNQLVNIEGNSAEVELLRKIGLDISSNITNISYKDKLVMSVQFINANFSDTRPMLMYFYYISNNLDVFNSELKSEIDSILEREDYKPLLKNLTLAWYITDNLNSTAAATVKIMSDLKLICDNLRKDSSNIDAIITHLVTAFKMCDGRKANVCEALVHGFNEPKEASKIPAHYFENFMNIIFHEMSSDEAELWQPHYINLYKEQFSSFLGTYAGLRDADIHLKQLKEDAPDQCKMEVTLSKFRQFYTPEKLHSFFMKQFNAVSRTDLRQGLVHFLYQQECEYEEELDAADFDASCRFEGFLNDHAINLLARPFSSRIQGMLDQFNPSVTSAAAAAASI